LLVLGSDIPIVFLAKFSYNYYVKSLWGHAVLPYPRLVLDIVLTLG